MNLTKSKLDIREEELLSEDGIFAQKYNTTFDNAEKCCQCGYPILEGEEALQLYINGDVIHKECWQEYAEENASSFGKDFILSESFNTEY